ncbi:transglycosylase family protein [Kitasatospora sp. NPDC088346]|uniref:transglycosylase family protein n=1 Tax=Kitasatospora sp. NPDC088346 TaxID=3364073 RepID=UPI003800384F
MARSAHAATWRTDGRLAYALRADQASREPQITVAQNLTARRGLTPRPACGAHTDRGTDRPAAHGPPPRTPPCARRSDAGGNRRGAHP